MILESRLALSNLFCCTVAHFVVWITIVAWPSPLTLKKQIVSYIYCMFAYMFILYVRSVSPRPPAPSQGWWWVWRVVIESADPPRSTWSRAAQSVLSRGRSLCAASLRPSEPPPATFAAALPPSETCRTEEDKFYFQTWTWEKYTTLGFYF